MAGMNRIEGYAYNQPLTASGTPKIVPGATVTIYLSTTLTEATLYANSTGATPLSNPITADVNGFFFAYTPAERVDLRFSGVGISTPYTLGDYFDLPQAPVSTVASFPASTTTGHGSFRVASDKSRGLWYDTGVQWSSLTHQVFDPTRYGARMNGVADDYAAFQTCSDAMYEVIGGGGKVGIFQIPKGIARFSQPWNLANFPSIGHGGAIFQGSGMQSTVLTIASNVNAPVIDLGGPLVSDALVTTVLTGFGIDGNKANQASVDAHGIRARFVDRCIVRDVLIQNTDSSAIYVDRCSMLFDACQVFLSDRHGWEVYDSTSVSIIHGYCNNNALRGIYWNWRNGGLLAAQTQMSGTVFDMHIEQNEEGGILVDGADNIVIEANKLNPFAGTSNPEIEISGTSQSCTLRDNMCDFTGDIGTYDDGSGTVSDRPFVRFNALTKDNIYIGPPRHGVNVLINSVVEVVPRAPLVIDLSGQNYIIDPLRHRISQHVGRSSHIVGGGWSDTPITNTAPQAKDLSNAAWTKVQIASATFVNTYGSPKAPIGSPTPGFATEVTINVNQVGYLEETCTVNVVGGQLVTFSAAMRSPGAFTRDVRMEIFDTSNNLLGRNLAILEDDGKWRRYSVGVVVQGTYASLKPRLSMVYYGSTPIFVVTDVQFEVDAMSPFIETGATAVTVPPGFYAATLGLAGGMTWTYGTGSPEGVETAHQGSLYSRVNGAAATTIYAKTSGGYSNTGWSALS